jgi:DNA-binding SARP family transcriptional activator/tetratricopeptide (TPR) repeat protein
LIADRLELVAQDCEVALLVDEVEHAGSEGAALLAALAARLPAGGHLVLSGRRLPGLSMARHVTAGTGMLLDIDDLAFTHEDLLADPRLGELLARTDPELLTWPALTNLVAEQRADLVRPYIRDNVFRGLEAEVAQSLAAVVAIGGCTADVLPDVVRSVIGRGAAAAAAIDVGSVVDAVLRLPLVQVEDGCWPHPIWSDIVGATLTSDQRDRAVVAKVRSQVDAGAIHDAGRQAVAGASSEGLRLAVRAALSTQPPRASFDDLRAWMASGVLSPRLTEHAWLRTVLSLEQDEQRAESRRQLEDVRRAFEADADAEAEISVLLHLGALARAATDPALVGHVLERGAVLASVGNPAGAGLFAVGQAVAAQLQGDPLRALAALERIPPGSLSGEWASQALMVRGTNLMLTGRNEEAIDALHSSTGEGSEATRSIAHDLLSTARWYAGDPLGALEDAELAATLARRAGTTRVVRQATAWRGCMLAAMDRVEEARSCLEQIRGVDVEDPTSEAGSLTRVAHALLAIAAGDLDVARRSLDELPVVPRAVRSSVWKMALTTAFSNGDAVSFENDDYATRQARAAGEAAATHLGGGPPPALAHRPYLPFRWCGSDGGSVTLRLSGASRVERDGVPVEHARWRRNRVRELCLHLALVGSADRAGVAAALWPDRSDRAAAQNLRVTLTHLLDVLDPDRPRSVGSTLIDDAEGSLALRPSPRLRVDVWEFQRSATAVVDLADHERPAILAHARTMVRIGCLPLAGGLAVGEWIEPLRRDRERLAVSAALRAGRHALAVADYELAEELGLLALGVDPWSGTAHALVTESRFSSGDLDGARSALFHAFETFDRLGLPPERALSRLSHRLDLYRRVDATFDRPRHKTG